MQDAFADFGASLTAPATTPEAITPSDTADLTHATRALYVGQTGNVRVRTTSGDTVTFANVAAGTLYPIRVLQVYATGTTASDLIGLS